MNEWKEGKENEWEMFALVHTFHSLAAVTNSIKTFARALHAGMKLILFSCKTRWNILFAQNHLTVQFYAFLFVFCEGKSYDISLVNLSATKVSVKCPRYRHACKNRERENSLNSLQILHMTFCDVITQAHEWWWGGLSPVLSDLGYIYLDAYNVDEVYILVCIFANMTPFSA